MTNKINIFGRDFTRSKSGRILRTALAKAFRDPAFTARVVATRVSHFDAASDGPVTDATEVNPAWIASWVLEKDGTFGAYVDRRSGDLVLNNVSRTVRVRLRGA